jgi:L-asparaginase II
MVEAAHKYLQVEVTRGNLVESRHRVSVAVVRATGEIMLQAGDVNRLIYARSSIKPLEAIALVESGAAAAFELSQAELALACASHNAEPQHVEAVTAWLTRIGLSIEDLECGPHLPLRQQTLEALLEAGKKPNRAYNNCSGQHAGLLTTALHLGVPTANYIQPEHPVRQYVLNILETMTGIPLKDAPMGVDGCGAPVYGMPLWRLALAMARLARPYDQPERRQRACQQIQQAMAAAPFMVAGTDRFCTRVMEVTGQRALIKVGAEGVYCGAFPEAGLGVALKVADGAWRAAEVAMGHILRELEILPKHSLTDAITPKLKNWAGDEVGEVRIGQ